MPTESDHIKDIALFFLKNGEKKQCWVSQDIYTKEQIKKDPAWEDAVFTNPRMEGGSFYVLNLANLNDPDDQSAAKVTEKAQKAEGAAPAAAAPPATGDLVVISRERPESAFVVRKGVYEDPSKCPELQETISADLLFMVENEGVVLANVPKTDLAGMSCQLLNLRAVRVKAQASKKESTNVR